MVIFNFKRALIPVDLYHFQTCSDCGVLHLLTQPLPVYADHLSILEADLLCLNALLDINKGTGVSILKENAGANMAHLLEKVG